MEVAVAYAWLRSYLAASWAPLQSFPARERDRVDLRHSVCHRFRYALRDLQHSALFNPRAAIHRRYSSVEYDAVEI